MKSFKERLKRVEEQANNIGSSEIYVIRHDDELKTRNIHPKAKIIKIVPRLRRLSNQ